jgi:hypothetical protein
MWVPGSLVYLIAMTVIFFRWALEESQLSAISDQRSATVENESVCSTSLAER